MRSPALPSCPKKATRIGPGPGAAALCGLLTWCLAGLAQPPATSPSSNRADEARLATLVSLITDLRTTPEARSFLLRDLLAGDGPAATGAMEEILTTCREPAVLASVCVALSELERPDQALVEPLLGLVGRYDGPVRLAATQALSAYDGSRAAAAVGRFALAPANAVSARLAALEALADMPEPVESIDALIAALDDPRPRIGSAAHSHLVGMGLEDLGPNAEAWSNWWAEHRHDSPVHRLQTVLRDTKRRLRATEQMLSASAARNLVLLREIYDRSSETEKTARLASLLGDAEPGVRVLGLELVNAMIADRKDIPPQVLQPLRELLSDPAPQVRRKAVPLVRDLRIPSDLDLLLTALAGETDETVLGELINALGRFGDPRAVEHLVPYLNPEYAPEVIGEAADSLGLLLGSARSAAPGLEPPVVAQAVSALLERFDDTPTERAALRERLLKAMAKIADPRFEPSFLAHVGDARSGMKSAAIQGLAALGDTVHAPLLMRHLADANTQVRQIAAQALGHLGEKEDHLEALLGRLDPEAEAVEAIRETVWEAFVRVFRKLEPVVQLRWADRLAPGAQHPAAGHERFVQLLLEIERTLTGLQNETDLLAEARFRLADAYAEMGRHADAVGSHQQIYEWLKSRPKARAHQIGAKILRSQLAAGRLTLAAEHLAFLLEGATEQEEMPLGQVVSDFLRMRLDQQEPDEVLALTDKLLNSESVRLSENWRAGLGTLRQEALDLRASLMEREVAEWVSQLCGGEEEAAAARRQILELGSRALGGLARALSDLLATPEHDPVLEAELVGLIRQIQPDWPGFPADAPLEQKRQFLAELAIQE